MRLKSSHQCRRCRFWLEGEWSRVAAVAADDGELLQLRRDLEAQMAAGECWECQGRRLDAALALIRAVDTVREWELLGGRPTKAMRVAVKQADHDLTAAGLRPGLPRMVRGETERTT